MVNIKFLSFIILIHTVRSSPQFGGLGGILPPAKAAPGGSSNNQPGGGLLGGAFGAAGALPGPVGSIGSAAAKLAAGLLIGFGDYKSIFKKNYIDAAEEAFRQEIFNKVTERITDHNELFKQGKVKFSLAINQFADWTPTEYLGIMGMDLSQADDNEDVIVTARKKRASGKCQSPDEKDWRELGAVTPIKDQLKCASCYAFSAAGALEGQFFIKNGKLSSFSEQQFVDCSKDLGNKGCNKGLMNTAFRYAKKSGIVTDDKYPYEGKDSSCRASTNSMKIAGIGKVPKGDEEKLMETVCSVGPVAAAIDASDEKFKSYHEGVYFNSDCNPNNTNHAILVVGYGYDETTDLDYWIIKNSFGKSWGEDGYGKVARNQKNHCGIANVASYPVL